MPPARGPRFSDAFEMRLTTTWEDLLQQQGRVVANGTASLPRRHRPLPQVVAQAPRTKAPRMCPSEDEEQIALIKWRDDAALPQEPLLDLLYHCPNGKKRGTAVAGQLKAMGVKRGIPDLFLPVPRHGYHGLYVEMKALDGAVDAEQKKVHARLRAQGYAVGVAYGWVMAAQQLCRYLSRMDLARQLGDTP